ncbi:uncharacterized protein LOC112563762 isoform X2 [Pomacea canaliculata]|uniref:uncharacterized protein LOC112563762 isoform X2 n=1 Tax=Pomacea canaliculata TaxID=400727 RepID=UPI000D72F71F|nr:uncharacterized protein LOC112563762 isoform X2 [Pomacea canaliculata]
MDGVRISGIKQDITKESVWKYFSGIVGTCGHVSKVYYPLMNNDAVIIFSNTEAVQKLQSQSHEMYTVHPLPPEVFTKVQVWVDSKIAALLLASGVNTDELTNGGGVQIGWDEATQENTLKGKMYEVEWAQKYLSDKCDNHSRMHGTLVSSLIAGRGGVDVIHGVKSLQLTNGDRVKDMSATGEQYSQPTEEEWKWSRSNEKVACCSHDCHSLRLPASKPSFSALSLETDKPTATFENGSIKQNSSLTKEEINYSMYHNDGESKIHSSEHGDMEKLRQQNSDDASQYLKSNIGAEGSHLLHEGSARTHWLKEEEDKNMLGVSQSLLPSTMACEISGPSTDHRSKDISDKVIGAYGGELSDDELNGAYGGGTLLGSKSTALFLASPVSADLISRNFSINSQLKLKIYCEDIVRVQTDAVVSPANSHLHNIGGVARALEYAAGPEMQDECCMIVRKMGRLMTTQVVETKACGRLGHLKYVFHAVGPIVSTDVEQSIYELSETFFNCLELAEKLHLRSLAFPFISTGIFGMSTDHCVLALITAVLAYPEMCSCISLQEVHFVHNDVNVVGEAIILADQQLENEDKESAKQRLQQGRQLNRLYDAYPHSLSYALS